MDRELIITPTEDGSPTIYVPEIDEHYHSTHGAVQESLHIFIGAGLHHWHSLHPTHEQVTIFEVGFGTGLNALLTAVSEVALTTSINYHTTELYPLANEIVHKLTVPQNTNEQTVWNALHSARWDATPSPVTPTFNIVKYWSDFRTMTLPDGIDVVYFDAFSPEKEPTLWVEALFTSLYHRMNIGGVLTTYCAKGEIRRRLTRSGFSVERLPGPPGKREILRATKLASAL